MNSFNFKKWNTILGWSTFMVALITYSLTVEPTMSFWDCGEYIATSANLEVGHPPGAPLFQMLGAFFAMFAFSPDKIALMVNYLSVFSSAFTVLFMFWSLTILLKKLIVGESLDRETIKQIKNLVKEESHVLVHINSVRSMFIGSDEVLLVISMNVKDDKTGHEIEQDIKELKNKIQKTFSQHKLDIYIDVFEF